MKLSSIEIEGFKRFDTKQTLRVDGKLLALLGLNEVGKTSILRALLTLNGAQPFVSNGGAQDISRGKQYPAEHVVITAKYLIDDSDRKAVKDVAQASELRWFVVEKLVSGALRYKLVPEIRRDIARRNQTIEKIRAAAQRSDRPDLNALMINAIDSFPIGDPESLPPQAIEKLSALSGALAKEHDPATASLASEVLHLLQSEKKDLPDKSVENIFVSRLPKFVMFSEQDRTLQSEYDLRPFFNSKQKTAVPSALDRLTRAAGLELSELFSAEQVKDEGKVETLTSRANAEMQRQMSLAWSQSQVNVRFRINNGILSILVGSQESGFEAISERSDGLRQFVALAAYLSPNISRKQRVVLLVDEAERHLHYDAQADLVQMFAKQELARQVIYTTHSIGCLPEDLGVGIHLVESTAEKSSKIISKFWSQAKKGLSPTLYGMGARTMAFLPVRYCLLTEGASDIILLPALLRQATGKHALGYQISPGLSEADDDEVAIIRNDGKRAAFLVDGDGGGGKILTKLKRAGVPSREIIRLGGPAGSPCVVEDFIDPNAYAAAINDELRRSGHQIAFVVGDLPPNLRPTKVKEWCSAQAVQMPNKVDVAYRVLDHIDENLVDPLHRNRLIDLHSRIEAIFKD